jgi:2'-5' RNA ligase
VIDPATIERNPAIRYGWYLRPSYEMSRDQAAMHQLLRQQFGLIGGGVFMPHATIKGFFRSDASVAEIIAAFDRAVQGHAPFTVHNGGPVGWGRGSIVIDIDKSPDGMKNGPLQALHESGWNEIAPLVHPECTFTPVEGAMENFRAHLTLAMADLKDEFFDEVMQFVNDAGPIGPGSFTAEYVHLFAFRSQDWSGRWWETLEWSWMKNWRLGE